MFTNFEELHKHEECDMKSYSAPEQGFHKTYW